MKASSEMPGYEAWEVGAGYVNAYAAVESVFLALQSSGSSNTKKGNK